MYFKLYACCIPVKGAAVSIVCDLQRASFLYIPTLLYEILTRHKKKNKEQLVAYFGEENCSHLESYFDYLLKNEYGFWTDEPNNFPPLDLSYESPAKIHNAIIDIDAASKHDYEKIFTELDQLGCYYVEIRCYDILPLATMQSILDHTKGMRFCNIDLILKYDPSLTPDELYVSLCMPYGNLGTVTVHSCPQGATVPPHVNHSIGYTTQVVDGAHCCGHISPGNFAITIPAFTEAQQFNTCLNKKISIDVNGNIKNCPSMHDSFGNIASDSLLHIHQLKKFRQLWQIKKDDIRVCKDCPFRYICTDCRAFTADLYDKPVKCTYDPYTNTWA